MKPLLTSNLKVKFLGITPVKGKLANLEKKRKEIFPSLKAIKKEWFTLLAWLQEILRDYNLALKIKVLSSIPWRVWGEKKRHRTCPQIIESIYYCIERTAKKFKKFKKQINQKRLQLTLRPPAKAGSFSKKLIKEIEEVFSIPPSIKNNPKFLSEYLLAALKSFEGYQNLIKLKIKSREAIFLIP